MFETDRVNMLAKETTFEWVTNMVVKRTAHRTVLKRVSIVSPVPNDHNPPPKRASSPLGSSQAYNRIRIPISSLGKKAKIDVDIESQVGEGLAVVVIEIGMSISVKTIRLLMMLPLMLVMLPKKALTSAPSPSSCFSPCFVCAAC